MKRTVLLASLLVAVVLYGLWHFAKARTFQAFGQIVSSVATEHRVVALTFDDGPAAKYTEEILPILRERGVKATFFVTGRETESNLDEARRIVEEGHDLGNHSYSHLRLVLKSPAQIQNEIERTDAAIRSSGYQGDIPFRPPYGKKLFVLPWHLAQNDRITVMWDVEPESYPEVASKAERITLHVVERVQPGSIVLLHVMAESRQESRRALPMIIDSLREQGYKFLTVSELLHHGDT